MRVITLETREAVIKQLTDNVYWKERVIPFYEEWVQESEGNEIAVIPFGNRSYEAYVIFKNQSDADSDHAGKCSTSRKGNFQLHVTTVWPANTGGSKQAELIADVIVSQLIQNEMLVAPFFTGVKCSQAKIEAVDNINYNNDAKHVWTTVLTISALLSY